MDGMELIASPSAWASLADIILVNVVLSGDNAVVIALAAHGLPAKQQKPAIIFGSAAAILMRAILTIFALQLLLVPYLKIIGGLFLYYVAIKLMRHQPKASGVAGDFTLGGAVRTILTADLVMSLDNVLGVAAAAKGNIILLIAGLALSVPLIVFGSALMLKIMVRFPIVTMMGAALLGYLGGEMLFSDAALQVWVQSGLLNRHITIGATDLQVGMPGTISALAVMLVGAWRARKNIV